MEDTEDGDARLFRGCSQVTCSPHQPSLFGHHSYALPATLHHKTISQSQLAYPYTSLILIRSPSLLPEMAEQSSTRILLLGATGYMYLSLSPTSLSTSLTNSQRWFNLHNSARPPHSRYPHHLRARAETVPSIHPKRRRR
jgi:hypothetical protein